MLDLSSRKVYGALAEQCVGGDAKADKVESAVAGHLAGLDSNGNLTDSGVSPTEEVTIEGNPVTFESPFEQDAKSVVVSVKPIQDLHGYDHPWVGGAGKNKLPLTVANLKAWNTSGTWSGNVYSINNGTIEVLTDNAGNVTALKVNGTFSATTYFQLSNERDGHGYEFLELNTQYYINGGDTNIGVRAYHYSGTTDATSYGTDESFTLSAYPNSANIDVILSNNIAYSNAIIRPMIRLATESDATFAPYSNICPISGIDEVEIGVSDGESEPTTTTIPLPSTLYGGTVDFKSGVVTVDRGFVTFDGSEDEDWNYTVAARCAFIQFNNVNRYPQVPFVNEFKALNNKSYLELLDDECAFSSNPSFYDYMNIITKIAHESLEAWRIWLASNPLQVCYELATPITIQLTPTDVELLEGTNVVSTNAEKVAVTYGRSLWQDIDELKTDTEGKLDKSDVADVEGDTASRPYSVNEFMLRSDGFYRVTAPIAQNASITASNTTKTTIGAVLTALLNA